MKCKVLLSLIIFSTLLALIKCEIDHPSNPVNLTSTSQSYNSITLKWDAPYNIGGGEESIVYIIMFSPPAINSSCVEDDTCITNENNFTVTGLKFGTRYTFIVYANNSAGTSEPSDNLTVLVPGDTPPSVSQVSVCLLPHNRRMEIRVRSIPCPVVIADPNTTPPITAYELMINKSLNLKMNEHHLCAGGHVMHVTEGTQYSVGVTVHNMVGPSQTTLSGTFYASWIRNVRVEHTENTLTVFYTTAACVENYAGLRVHLSLNTGPFSSMNYEPNANRIFTVSKINPTRPLTLTLQVVNTIGNKIGEGYTSTIYAVTATPTTSPPPTQGVPEKKTGLNISSLPIIIGIVVGSVTILLLIGLGVVFVGKRLKRRFKLHFAKEEFEYRTPKKDSRDPSTSQSLSVSLSDDIYSDMEIHKQNPMLGYVPDYEEVVTNTSAL